MKLILSIAIALALLGGLFYAFSPEQKTVPAATRPDPPAEAPISSAPPALPASATGANSELTTPTAQLPAASTSSASTVIEVVVSKGKLTSGQPVVRLKKGDPVVLRVTSDVADELHLHGYNLHLRLKPGQTATLEFAAKKTGRFTYELHHAELELGVLEIYPR